MLEKITSEQWLTDVESGAQVITVNRRLARSLHDRYDTHQVSRQAHWPTPSILPFDAWLSAYWQARIDEQTAETNVPTLLTNLHAELVLQRIINQQQKHFLSSSIDELTSLAMKAWTLLNEWLLPLEELASADSPNVQAFFQWMQEYQHQCQQREWMDHAALANWVITSVTESNHSFIAKKIIFAGFDEFSPRQLQLVTTLQQRGITVSELAFPQKQEQLERRIFQNSEAEVLAMANWVAATLTQQPKATIGIVVPDLNNQRAEISACLEQTLHSATQLEYGQSKHLFNITLGYSLTRYPIIKAVFSIFKLTQPLFSVEHYTNFLLNPYFIHSEQELHRRAIFDVDIRQIDEEWLSIDTVCDVYQYFASHTGELKHIDHLGALKEFNQGATQRRFPSQWALLLAKLLQQLQWANALALSSEEYQVYLAWQRVLDQFSQLDQVAGEMDWHDACALLHKMTADTVFQAEAADVPVHVMGVFETAGLAFDALWVMGLDDETLPASPSPNPLIPMWLQKKYDLPHSSCEREWRYATDMMTRISTSAAHVVLSCALQQGEAALRPSPLMQVNKEQPVEDVDTVDNLLQLIHQSADLESWPDVASPLSGEAPYQVKGGASLFKHQAACPFRAFSYYRLLASSINYPSVGLNALDRGILLHGVLEDFWRQVGSQAALLELSKEQECSILSKSAKRQLKRFEKRKPATLTPRFIAMERQRLVERVSEWLELERQRPPFVVQCVEDQQTIQIQGLALNTKMDRIDCLHDEGWLLIDYKTGLSQVKNWFGERPDEPQLPLYATALSDQVKGVAFAQLKVGELAFKGLAESASVPKGVEQFSGSKYAFGDADWQALLEEWREKLHSLALEYKSGVAQVAPRDGEQTCRFCDLSAFCRVKVLQEKNVPEVQSDGR